MAGSGFPCPQPRHDAVKAAAALAAALGSLAALANLQDGSGLLLPSLDVSVSDEVAWTSGAYLGGGAAPDHDGLQSEFGLYPSMVFTQMRAYF